MAPGRAARPTSYEPAGISSVATGPVRPYAKAMTQPPFLTGQILLAMPGMADPRFDHAVIAMCSHDEGGALGIGMGATVAGLGFHDLLDQLDIDRGEAPDAPVHFGGPVEPRRGFILHTRDWTGQDTIDVAGLWSLSATLDVLRAIAAGTGPARWIAALGYAGWGAGQLDVELRTPGWFNVPSDTTLLFDAPADERWSRAFAAAGIDPRLLASQAGTA
jgi:putative transcriptional regulator